LRGQRKRERKLRRATKHFSPFEGELIGAEEVIMEVEWVTGLADAGRID
jgi:hypothetical protein